MPSEKRRRLGPSLLWTAAAIACVSLAALVAITVTLVTKIASPDQSIYRLALAASFTDILALVFALVIAVLFQRRLSFKSMVVWTLLSVILAAVAAFLSVYALVSIFNGLYPTNDEATAQDGQILSIAGFVVWAIAVTALFMLHILALSRRKKARTVLPLSAPSGRTTPAKLVKRSFSSRAETPLFSPTSRTTNPRSDNEPVSSAFSAYSDSVRVSFRHSVSKIIRPVTSRTRLLLHHPLPHRDTPSAMSTKNSSIDTAREVDGFDNWSPTPSRPATPTAAVVAQTRSHKRCAKQGRLETIPGSRPASPGNLLEWPFPGTSQQAPTTSPPTSPTSTTSSHGIYTQPLSRRQSGTDQKNIHPLFRSESPVPPPLASPGTVITASPYAGQVVSPEHQRFGPRSLHSAQSSRPGSPVITSPMRSRQSSLRQKNSFTVNGSTSEPTSPTTSRLDFTRT